VESRGGNGEEKARGGRGTKDDQTGRNKKRWREIVKHAEKRKEHAIECETKKPPLYLGKKLRKEKKRKKKTNQRPDLILLKTEYEQNKEMGSGGSTEANGLIRLDPRGVELRRIKE